MESVVQKTSKNDSERMFRAWHAQRSNTRVEKRRKSLRIEGAWEVLYRVVAKGRWRRGVWFEAITIELLQKQHTCCLAGQSGSPSPRQPEGMDQCEMRKIPARMPVEVSQRLHDSVERATARPHSLQCRLGVELNGLDQAMELPLISRITGQIRASLKSRVQCGSREGEFGFRFGTAA